MNSKRSKIVIGTNALVSAGAALYLWETWFTSSPLRSFHFTNDNTHWMQMDKVGHAYSSYFVATYFEPQFQWMGMRRRKAVFWSTGLSFLATSSVDIMDGFSSKWGASWGDLLGNAAGSALFLGQELAWQEQRIQFKFSYSPTELWRYNTALGSSPLSRIVQDYNGQTYWLSCNLKSFLPSSRLPQWLNLAVGYGAHNMTDRITNLPSDENGLPLPKLERYRQFYLSPDVSFRRIKTEKTWLKIMCYALDFVKLPAPTLEYRSTGNVQLHWLHF